MRTHLSCSAIALLIGFSQPCYLIAMPIHDGPGGNEAKKSVLKPINQDTGNGRRKKKGRGGILGFLSPSKKDHSDDEGGCSSSTAQLLQDPKSTGGYSTTSTSTTTPEAVGGMDAFLVEVEAELNEIDETIERMHSIQEGGASSSTTALPQDVNSTDTRGTGSPPPHTGETNYSSAGIDESTARQQRADALKRELLEGSDNERGLFDVESGVESKKGKEKKEGARRVWGKKPEASGQPQDGMDDELEDIGFLRDPLEPSSLKKEKEVAGADDSSANTQPQRRSRAGTEEDAMVPFVRPRTWWEALISISEERRDELHALNEQEQVLAAQLALTQDQVKLVKGPGSDEIQTALQDDEVKVQVLAQLRLRLRLARKLIQDAQMRHFLTETAALKAKEKVEVAEASVREQERRKSNSVGWLWQLLGYSNEDEVPQQEGIVHDDVHPSDESTDAWLFDLLDVGTGGFRPVDVMCLPETFEYEYTEVDSDEYAKMVSAYLDNKTPFSAWETAVGIWFAREGTKHEYKLTPIANPLTGGDDAHEKSSRRRKSSKVVTSSSKTFTVQEVEGFFRREIGKYLKGKVFVFNWAPHVWKFLAFKQADPETSFMDQAEYLSLERDMEMARKVSKLLVSRVPSFKWTDETWSWFEQRGYDKSYGDIEGSDYFESLKTSRTIPKSVEVYIQDRIPPNRWGKEEWGWFEAFGLGRAISGIEFDQILHAAMEKQRNVGFYFHTKDGSDSTQQMDKALCVAPEFSVKQDTEFTKRVQTLVNDYGADVLKWRLEDVVKWDLTFVQWLLHFVEDRMFDVPGPGGRKQQPLPFHKLFKKFAGQYLTSAMEGGPLEQNLFVVNWQEWDVNTSYWFERYGRDQQFDINDSTVTITSSIHRAFLRERDYFDMSLELLSGEKHVYQVPSYAWEWFQEAHAAGKVFRVKIGSDDYQVYKTSENTVSNLMMKAMASYLVKETSVQEWREDIWQWLQEKWNTNACVEYAEGSTERKYLIYHVLDLQNTLCKLTEEQYNKLVAERSAGDEGSN